MRKNELVIAALAAVALTIGSASVAHAAAGCWETCAEAFGSETTTVRPSGTTTETLVGCTEESTGPDEEDSVTTCYYTVS
jgi:hypothetical protein